MMMLAVGSVTSSSFPLRDPEDIHVDGSGWTDSGGASPKRTLSDVETGVGTKVALLMLDPGNVLAARPLKELHAHIKNGICPSLHLVVRCIKVLVLAIFRWHFCDFAMLATIDALAVSLPKLEDKKSFRLDQLVQLDEQYRFMLENAFVYKFKPTDDLEPPQHNSDQKTIYIGGDTFLKPLEFEKYEEINPQTIRVCYSDSYGYKITPKETGNTLSDLFNSKNLELRDNPF